MLLREKCLPVAFCKLCTTVWKMWLGWVEHQHQMSARNSAQNLGFSRGNALLQGLRHSDLCVSPGAGCVASPLCGYGNLPDISTPHFSTHWKCCVPLDIY